MAAATQRATVRPAMAFDPNTDSANLKKAMKGVGTDEKIIIQILGRRTSQQRQEIIRTYQSLYGKDLVQELKKELSGNFEDAILAIMTPLPNYLAQELKGAMKGLGTNEKTLIEILCTRDNKSITEIKSTYLTLYGKSLEHDLKVETSGDFKNLLIMMISGVRDEVNSDRSLSMSLAESLYKAGEKKKFGTDESEFNRIVSSYSFPLLRFVFEDYEKVSGHDFEDAIKSELSGDYKEAMLSIYNCIVHKDQFFANLLRECMKGIGAKKNALLRIIVSRCEIDLGNIKDEYHKMFDKKLEDHVKDETSGDFKKILMALIQE